MTLQKKIGERIKEIRKKHPFIKTQSDIANFSNLDKSFVSKVETGKINTSLGSLQKIIVDGLGMTIHEFFDDYRFMSNK